MIKFKNYRKNFVHHQSGVNTKILDYRLSRSNKNTLNNIRRKIVLTNYGASFTNKICKIQISLSDPFIKNFTNETSFRLYDSTGNLIDTTIENVNNVFTLIFIKTSLNNGQSRDYFLEFGNNTLHSKANDLYLSSAFYKIAKRYQSFDLFQGRIIDEYSALSGATYSANIIYSNTNNNILKKVSGTATVNTANSISNSIVIGLSLPALVTSGVFFRSTEFDNNGANYSSNTSLSIYAIAKATSASNHKHLYTELVENQNFFISPFSFVSGSLRFAVTNGGSPTDFVDYVIPSLNQFNILSFHYQANTTNGMKVFCNGSLIAQANTSNITLPFCETMMLSTPYAGTDFVGEFGEIIRFDQILNDKERAEMDLYFNSKFNISSSNLINNTNENTSINTVLTNQRLEYNQVNLSNLIKDYDIQSEYEIDTSVNKGSGSISLWNFWKKTIIQNNKQVTSQDLSLLVANQRSIRLIRNSNWCNSNYCYYVDGNGTFEDIFNIKSSSNLYTNSIDIYENYNIDSTINTDLRVSLDDYIFIDLYIENINNISSIELILRTPANNFVQIIDNLVNGYKTYKLKLNNFINISDTDLPDITFFSVRFNSNINNRIYYANVYLARDHIENPFFNKYDLLLSENWQWGDDINSVTKYYDNDPFKYIDKISYKDDGITIDFVNKFKLLSSMTFSDLTSSDNRSNKIFIKNNFFDQARNYFIINIFSHFTNIPLNFDSVNRYALIDYYINSYYFINKTYNISDFLYKLFIALLAKLEYENNNFIIKQSNNVTISNNIDEEITDEIISIEEDNNQFEDKITQLKIKLTETGSFTSNITIETKKTININSGINNFTFELIADENLIDAGVTFARISNILAKENDENGTIITNTYSNLRFYDFSVSGNLVSMSVQNLSTSFNIYLENITINSNIFLTHQKSFQTVNFFEGTSKQTNEITTGKSNKNIVELNEVSPFAMLNFTVGKIFYISETINYENILNLETKNIIAIEAVEQKRLANNLILTRDEKKLYTVKNENEKYNEKNFEVIEISSLDNYNYNQAEIILNSSHAIYDNANKIINVRDAQASNSGIVSSSSNQAILINNYFDFSSNNTGSNLINYNFSFSINRLLYENAITTFAIKTGQNINTETIFVKDGIASSTYYRLDIDNSKIKVYFHNQTGTVEVLTSTININASTNYIISIYSIYDTSLKFGFKINEFYHDLSSNYYNIQLANSNFKMGSINDTSNFFTGRIYEICFWKNKFQNGLSNINLRNFVTEDKVNNFHKIMNKKYKLY